MWSIRLIVRFRILEIFLKFKHVNKNNVKKKFKNLVNGFEVKVVLCAKFQELMIIYVAEISLKVISTSYSSKP